MSTIVRDEPSTAPARRAMVENQIRTFDVTDHRVLEAFATVPREVFVAPQHADLAYSDAVLTVAGSDGTRRTLLPPLTLARMIQGLGLREIDRVLVLAAGEGYAAAILAELCASVVAVETDQGFVQKTIAHASALGYTRIEAYRAPLNQGYAPGAPYDAILICGGVERDLSGLLEQLKVGGRLVTIRADAAFEATRRAAKVIRYDRFAHEVSSRALFDAVAPVLDDFRHEPSFVF